VEFGWIVENSTRLLNDLVPEISGATKKITVAVVTTLQIVDTLQIGGSIQIVGITIQRTTVRSEEAFSEIYSTLIRF
jgi:hypothetical protein